MYKRTVVTIWKLLIAVLALLLARKYFDRDVFLSALQHPLLVAALIGMWIVNQVLISWRLQLLFRPVGCRLSLWKLTRVGFIAMLFAGLLPGVIGNDVGKIALLRSSNSSLKIHTITTGVLLDRVLGLATLILFSLTASLFLSADGRTDAQSGVIRLVQAASLCLFLGWGAVMLIQRRIATTEIGSSAGGSRIKQIVGKAAAYSRIWTLSLADQGRISGASILGISVLVLTQALAAAALMPTPASGDVIAKALFIFPALTLVAALPLTPLGLGLGQLAIGEGFILFGLPAEVGVTIATLSQLSQVLVAVSVGGLLAWTPLFSEAKGAVYSPAQNC